MPGRPDFAALAVALVVLAARTMAAGAPSPIDVPPTEPAATTESASSSPPGEILQPSPPTREKLSRIWANEPPLVRLARDKFGAELTEIDARFFAAVADNEWADFRDSKDSTFDPESPSSWATAPTLRADRLTWLCTDSAAAKHVSARGVWLRGVHIVGKLDLYRSNVPFSLTLYDCLFQEGLNVSHARLQELDVRNCCSAAVQARALDVAENVYLLNCCIFGGIDMIDAHIGGDFDASGGLVFHGRKAEDLKKPGVALNLHDAKIGGDVKLADKFRSFGQVRLIGATIGRSLICSDATLQGAGEEAMDARRTTIDGNVILTAGFVAHGGVEMRRAKVGGDLDCNGGKFIAANTDAFNADLITVGGQALLGDGYRADGETRFINATITGDLDCDNGHFVHPDGDALSLDGATIGRSLRIGADAGANPTDDLPPGFLSRGTLRLWSTQINQDLLADRATFENPSATAILGCNLKVAGRVVLTGVRASGTVNLFAADIAHELDLRGGRFDGTQSFGRIALWASSIQVRGHVYCNQVDSAEPPYRFQALGLTSFQFATIGMHWDLYGAELENPAGDALDASDCRVGGYVNIDTVKIDGRASFSRAKIDGMWILNKTVQPEKLLLDLRFAHIWVIKDERLADWPPGGQLQLEGLVYDHFDDDSPLDVKDRLAWLRRQYAPRRDKTSIARNTASTPHPRVAGAHLPQVRLHDPQLARPNGAHISPSLSPATTAAGDRYAVEPARYDVTMPATPAVVHSAPDEPVAPGLITPAAESADVVETPPAGAEAPAESPTKSTLLAAESAGEISPGAAQAEVNPDDATDETGATAGHVEKIAVPADPAGRRYITQPYTQLASVYRAIGQDEQANMVLVARAERLGELAQPFSAQALWYRYLGRLIGYGYEPFRAIKIGLIIVAIGAVVFWIGARRNLMAETKLAEQVLSSDDQTGKVSPTYPRFNALVYSLDVFLPFVELNQVCYWIPGEIRTLPRKSRNCLMHIGPYSLKWSTLLHSYLWFQTLAGWTLCTLLAAAVTGIVES